MQLSKNNKVHYSILNLLYSTLNVSAQKNQSPARFNTRIRTDCAYKKVCIYEYHQIT